MVADWRLTLWRSPSQEIQDLIRTLLTAVHPFHPARRQMKRASGLRFFQEGCLIHHWHRAKRAYAPQIVATKSADRLPGSGSKGRRMRFKGGAGAGFTIVSQRPGPLPALAGTTRKQSNRTAQDQYVFHRFHLFFFLLHYGLVRFGSRTVPVYGFLN